MCTQSLEFIDHLLIYCVVSCEVWLNVLRHFGWHNLAPVTKEKLAEWWLRVRKHVPKARHKAFNSIVALVSRSLWLSRNACIFKQWLLVADHEIVRSVLDQVS
jgi:hypothetical protein